MLDEIAVILVQIAVVLEYMKRSYERESGAHSRGCLLDSEAAVCLATSLVAALLGAVHRGEACCNTNQRHHDSTPASKFPHWRQSIDIENNALR